MGDELIERRIDGVRRLLDDLGRVADEETVEEFEGRLDQLEDDLKAAFESG